MNDTKTKEEEYKMIQFTDGFGKTKSYSVPEEVANHFDELVQIIGFAARWNKTLLNRMYWGNQDDGPVQDIEK